MLSAYIHVGSVLFALRGFIAALPALIHGSTGSSRPELNHTANPNCRPIVNRIWQ